MEHELEQYMSAREWVTMREIYADLQLSREQGERVWRTLLPGLSQLGLVEQVAPEGPRLPTRFRATTHFRDWVTAGEGRRAQLAAS